MDKALLFWKFFLEDLKRRWWMVFFIFIAYFSTLNISFLLNTKNFTDLRVPNEDYFYNAITNKSLWFTAHISFNNIALWLFTILFAISCALLCFSYLHSIKKCDLYHSIPITKTMQFSVRFVSGIAIFILPYFCNFILCMVLGSFYNCINKFALTSSIKIFIFYICFFILIYSVSILAMIFAGRTSTGILLACIFFGYGPYLTFLFHKIHTTFFTTAWYWSPDILSWELSPFSPVSWFFLKYTQYYNQLSYFSELKITATDLFISITVTFIIISIALWAYNRRPSESAGNAMAFPFLQDIVKIFIVIPFSVGMGVSIFYSFEYNIFSKKEWMIFGSLLFCLFLNMVFEAIYHRSIFEFLRHKRSLLISLVLCGCIAYIIPNKVIDIDTYIPKENNIKSISFNLTDRSFTNYVNIPSTNLLYHTFFESFESYEFNYINDHSITQLLEVSEFSPLYELALEGVRNVDKMSLDLKSQDQYESIEMKYTLKSGIELHRRYIVSKLTAEKVLAQLTEDSSYKNIAYAINHVDFSTVKALYINGYDYRERLKLDDSLKLKFLQTYQKDMNNISYDEMCNAVPIGNLEIEADPSYERINNNFYIYSQFTNTIKLLKDSGYIIPELPQTKEIKYIQITHRMSNSTYKFDSDEDINELLSNICFFKDNWTHNNKYDDTFEVVISYKNIKNGAMKSKILSLMAERAPACLQKLPKEKVSSEDAHGIVERSTNDHN